MEDRRASETWIYSLLAANNDLMEKLGAPATGRNFSIYLDLAPDGATAPYIVYQFIPGMQDDTTQGGRYTVMIQPLYLVKVVVEGVDNSLAGEISGLIYDTLHGASATWEGYPMNCIRTEPFAMPFVDKSKQFRQSGGYYRVLVRHNL